MALNIFQKGFNYSQDGWGNRLVYHLQGCNLHCPWCANPEGIAIVPPLHPLGNLPADHSVSIDQLVAEAVGRKPMFFDGGGVTLTGGEPTLQFDGVVAFLKGLKSVEIHTALETNGTSPMLPLLFPLVDQLMMDFKHPNTNTHRSITGQGNERILDNIRLAVSSRELVHIRIPLIGGFNTGINDLDGFVGFLDTLDPTCFTLELLPYHEYGKHKWQQCGMAYHMDESAYVTNETLRTFTDCFNTHGYSLIKT